jgi:hypothetical protein
MYVAKTFENYYVTNILEKFCVTKILENIWGGGGGQRVTHPKAISVGCHSRDGPLSSYVSSVYASWNTRSILRRPPVSNHRTRPKTPSSCDAGASDMADGSSMRLGINTPIGSSKFG